jgi:predicted HTH transcriptional regulator
LLFGLFAQTEVPSAKVVVRARGRADWIAAASGQKRGDTPDDTALEQVIIGNLWNQYDTVMSILGSFNRPFRLKGATSETVMPYPPLAIKEVVVNALVHRDYSVADPTIIDIAPGSIQITNPGGLVEEVQRRVEQSIESEIRNGRRGIKGYRNPVIADLFYGSGEMDKRGSGLSDVLRMVRDAGGDVRFGPDRRKQRVRGAFIFATGSGGRGNRNSGTDGFDLHHLCRERAGNCPVAEDRVPWAHRYHLDW